MLPPLVSISPLVDPYYQTVNEVQTLLAYRVNDFVVRLQIPTVLMTKLVCFHIFFFKGESCSTMFLKMYVKRR